MNYIPVRPPQRRVRWWQRVPWRALFGVVAVGVASGVWEIRAPGPWWHVLPVVAVFGLLMCAAVADRWDEEE